MKSLIRKILKEDFKWMGKPFDSNEVTINNAHEGMRVMLKKPYKGQYNEFNPENGVGTIINVYHQEGPDNELLSTLNLKPTDIEVEWDNGKTNYYADNELLYVSDK